MKILAPRGLLFGEANHPPGGGLSLVRQLGAILLLVLCGCAVNRVTLRTEETGTNGVTTVRITRSSTWALWPATSDLHKQRVTNLRGHGVGTEELHQETGGTNVVAALHALDSILSKIKP